MVNHFFLDTSALIKRYKTELGTTWLKNLIVAKPERIIILSEITIAEVASALAALHRATAGITRTQRDQAMALFLYHCETEYKLISAHRLVIDRAVTLTQAHRLRGCDAIQLATAVIAKETLSTEAFTFVAADNDLLMAAQAEGLKIDNPNQHA